jgi:hypothetical protein
MVSSSPDVRLPHVNELSPDVPRVFVATLIAQAFADTLGEPIPPRLRVILERLEQQQQASRSDG